MLAIIWFRCGFGGRVPNLKPGDLETNPPDISGAQNCPVIRSVRVLTAFLVTAVLFSSNLTYSCYIYVPLVLFELYNF